MRRDRALAPPVLRPREESNLEGLRS